MGGGGNDCQILRTHEGQMLCLFLAVLQLRERLLHQPALQHVQPYIELLQSEML